MTQCMDAAAPPVVISFFVPGKAAPGGSKTSHCLRRKDGSLVMRPGTNSPLVVTREDGKGNKEWRADVKAFAFAAYQGPPLEGPIALRVTFYRTRPKGHYGTGKNAKVLKGGVLAAPICAPDATKLLRALEDALTGVLWVDDAQVVDQTVMKRWADNGQSGALVEVRPWNDGHAQPTTSRPPYAQLLFCEDAKEPARP